MQSFNMLLFHSCTLPQGLYSGARGGSCIFTFQLLTMKQLYHIAIYFFLLCAARPCAAQDSTSVFYLKEVRMHVKVPKDFVTVDSAEDVKNMKQGKQLIEESNNIIADISDTKILLSAKKGPYNYLNITATPYPDDEAKWKEENNVVKNMLFNTFQEKIPSAVLDSSSTAVVIDGVPFDRFRLTVKINENATLKMFLFSNLYNGYDLGITYMFMNPAIGIQLQAMVMESTFDKAKP
jgi:hypothetical protein